MGVHPGDEAAGAIGAMRGFRGANVIWLSQRHPGSRQSFHDRSGVIATLRSRRCQLLCVARLAGTERNKSASGVPIRAPGLHANQGVPENQPRREMLLTRAAHSIATPRMGFSVAECRV